jgi:hypothetical protein
MGFSLTIAPMTSICDEDTCRRLSQWLMNHSVHVNETIVIDSESKCFPFEPNRFQNNGAGETSEFVEIIRHHEVGLNWWSIVVKEMEKVMGTKGVKTCQFVRPTIDAAVPADIENQHLIQHKARNVRAGIIIKLLSLFTKTSATGDVMIMMDGDNSKVVHNSHLVSAARLLIELEAACVAWRLPTGESEARSMAKELYESKPNDNTNIAHCYALIVRSFLRYAVANNHIVWFIK